MKKFDKNLLDPGNISMTDLEIFLNTKYPGYGTRIAGYLEENEIYLAYFKETCNDLFGSPTDFLQWKHTIADLMGIDYMFNDLGFSLRRFFRNEKV